jgi:thymidylate synthase (FAD)
VELLEHTPDPQKIIALAAKLCYSQSEIGELKAGLEEKDISGFIQKIISLGHLSCLEHVSFTFGIEGVSRALLAQITRHRIASFSVQSQRYVSCRTMKYIIPPKIEALGKEAIERFEEQMHMAGQWYKEWQERLGGENETANEDARFVLPNACETKILITMNARELLHFFKLRTCFRAQWEIRDTAWKMLSVVRKVAPALFGTAGPACLTDGICGEGKMSCGKAKGMKTIAKNILDGIK